MTEEIPYFKNQDHLYKAMTARGFDMLRAGARAASTITTPLGWRGGARYYVDFALANPRLYELMFSTTVPTAAHEAEQQMFSFSLSCKV